MTSAPRDPSATGSHRLPGPGRAPAQDDDATAEFPAAHAPRTNGRGRERKIGPYRLLGQLGEGGMGVVFRALAPTGDEVAIKVLRPHVAYDSKARERLRREVAVLTRVRADGVAGVIDADVDGEQPYLVTEYVPGPPLDEVVEERGPLSPAQLVTLGRGLAESLRAIHDSGVVHRDLKPGNVLMVGDAPVLIDFGIAHIGDDARLTQTGLVMGTPGYLSPEIIDGADVGPATDWWGWAATLAFAASGQAPFGKGPMPVILDRVARGQADLSGVDPRIRPLLEAALSPQPQYRPSADEVLRELEVFARGGVTGEIVQRRRPPVMGTTPLHHKQTPVRPQRPSTELVQPPQQGAPAPWAAPMGHEVAPGRDPRIGQPARTWTLLALAVALTAVAAVVPIVAWFAALAWVFAARWNDKAITAMVLRRYAAGRRRSDTAVAMALSPWHALLAAFSTLLVSIIPAFLGAVAMVATAFASGLVNLSSSYDRPLAVGVGTAVALATAWWGPGGTATRRGSRSLVRTVARTQQITLAVVVAAGALAAGCALYLAGNLDASLHWWPYSDMSQVPGAGLIPSIPADWG
ncbi:serine/threonine protein kinase [Yimella sp. cx-573]|nr:serine/threonine protein kinase [Yimella sp. cx-573]